MLDSDQAYIEGLLRITERSGIVRFTRFLDPASAQEVKELCAKRRVPCRFFGGYDQAERVIAALGAEEEDELDFPFRALEILWDDRFDKVEHRDLLGALMALGTQRDSFGDIVLAEGAAYLLVISELAEYIKDNLTQAGRAHLQVSMIDSLQEKLPTRKTRTVTTTVMSPRMDAILAAAFGLSRERAATAARTGLVKLNHVEQLHPDTHLKQGDLLSLRGKGRAELVEIGGTSKKGRTFIKIQIF